MKILFPRSAALVLAASLLAACGRKDSPTSEAAPAAREQTATEPPAATASDQATAAATDAAFLQQMPPAGLPAEEQASYETWFQKYHLDLTDPQMLAADADGDGVSNRDEFLAGTNPRDPASKPAPAEGRAPLRYKEYNEVRLPLVLESVRGTQAVIKRSDDGATQTLRAGDAVAGWPLRVAKISGQQGRDKDGNPVDRSQVLLEDTATKERVTLLKDLPAKTSATYAILSSEDGKTTMKVHAGETFVWPGEPPVSYRVIELGRDQVMLQEQGTRVLWTLPRQ